MNGIARWIPDRKYLSGGLSGVIAWALATFSGLDGELSLQIAGAVAAAVAYFVPPSVGDIIKRVGNGKELMRNMLLLFGMQENTSRLRLMQVLLRPYICEHDLENNIAFTLHPLGVESTGFLPASEQGLACSLTPSSLCFGLLRSSLQGFALALPVETSLGLDLKSTFTGENYPCPTP